ncbi:YchJ family protein [Desulfogranum marinum]|uniref:YchJ family protein n=1 Tax=Desulfogranum marinum TaxID=453220 RepID=UPI001966B548|nr:YchJ family protein [Desulfogranum marinum]MBM9513339.1 YchJ family protein [Desulfogranum marinum]
MVENTDTKPIVDMAQLCPCDSGLTYGKCCHPLHSGQRHAPTAEALMRSRYSGYVAQEIPYILQTWHPSTRPLSIDPNTIAHWCGLKILATSKGGENDHQGTVEFTATAMDSGRISQLHEVSCFVKENGQWLYVSGEVTENNTRQKTANGKVGRNVPCPCGSGKKYKKCCGR